MARYERAVISCTAADAAQQQEDSLVAAPPAGAERVEFVLELQQLTQVRAHCGLESNTKYAAICGKAYWRWILKWEEAACQHYTFRAFQRL